METCIKCGYIRQPEDTAPEWQCPSCEVAYSKAEKAVRLEQERQSKEEEERNAAELKAAKKAEKEAKKAAKKAEAEKKASEKLAAREAQLKEWNTTPEREAQARCEAVEEQERLASIQQPTRTSSSPVILLAIVLLVIASPFLILGDANVISFIGSASLMIIFGTVAMYFLPWLVGLSREHNAVIAIFFVNLLLGWTLLGWIVCLVWSLNGDTKNTRIIVVRK